MLWSIGSIISAYNHTYHSLVNPIEIAGVEQVKEDILGLLQCVLSRNVEKYCLLNSNLKACNLIPGKGAMQGDVGYIWFEK